MWEWVHNALAWVGGVSLVGSVVIILFVWRAGHVEDRRRMDMVEIKGCKSKGEHHTAGDMTWCAKCGGRWDTNDPSAVCLELVRENQWLL